MIRTVVSDLEEMFKIIESKKFQAALGEGKMPDLIRSLLEISCTQYAKECMNNQLKEATVVPTPYVQKESSSKVSLEDSLKAIPSSSELALSKKSIQNIVYQVGEMTTVDQEDFSV